MTNTKRKKLLVTVVLPVRKINGIKRTHRLAKPLTANQTPVIEIPVDHILVNTSLVMIAKKLTNHLLVRTDLTNRGLALVGGRALFCELRLLTGSIRTGSTTLVKW